MGKRDSKRHKNRTRGGYLSRHRRVNRPAKGGIDDGSARTTLNGKRQGEYPADLPYKKSNRSTQMEKKRGGEHEKVWGGVERMQRYLGEVRAGGHEWWGGGGSWKKKGFVIAKNPENKSPGNINEAPRHWVYYEEGGLLRGQLEGKKN